MVRQFFISAVFLGCFFPAAVVAGADAEQVSTLADQEAVQVTIYNKDLAMIKDRRRITLQAGMNTLALQEVSGALRPETALLRSVSHDRQLTVIEQNFDFDLLTPKKLLEKYVGRQVGVVRTHPTTGEETVEMATVLSVNQGVVLLVGDRIETGMPGRLNFPGVPDNLRERPTLVVTLQSLTDQPQSIELSYLSGGLSWQADYVVELNEADTQLAVNGWVTLTNTSGTSYNNAGLQLVAGDIHQVSRDLSRRLRSQSGEMAYAMKAPPMAEESLFEYHLYSLDRPTTISQNQTKQVALLQAVQVPCGKEYQLQGQEYYYQAPCTTPVDNSKVEVYLSFVNRHEDNLGIPLPKGVVRVYKRDSRGGIQFVGEDLIDHTPENEAVRLKLGNAFDVTAARKQVDFKKLAGAGRYNYVYESSYEVALKNARDEAVAVKVLEPLPGDWEIMAENLEHVKESAGTAAWLMMVPAKGAATLAYRARVRY